MGNQTHSGPGERSHLHSSTESLEKMDTSGPITQRYLPPHAYKKDCPVCSGLCYRRHSPRDAASAHPSTEGASGRYSQLSTNNYAETFNCNRCDDNPGANSPCSSSYSLGMRVDHGASDNTFNPSAVHPPPSNANSYRFNDAGSSVNNFGDSVSPCMSFGSAYEVGYKEGLKVGYDLAIAEFRAKAADGTDDTGSDKRHPPNLGNIGTGGTNVNNAGSSYSTGAGYHHETIGPSSHVRPIALWSDNDAQAGPSNQANSTDGENFLGLSAADKEDILSNAKRITEAESGSSSPTHSDDDGEEAKSRRSVRPKSRATSYDVSFKTKKPLTSNTKALVTSILRGRSLGAKGKGNGGGSSRKGNLYPSLDHLEGHDRPRQEKFRKKPASQQEKLLAEHTTEVFYPPPAAPSRSKRRASSSSRDDAATAPPDCSICMTSVAEDSSYQKNEDASRDLVGCVALKLCGHHFHTSCLMQMATHNTSCLTCPNCQTIHGVRMGTQPKNGNMRVRQYHTKLPGFPKSKGTIEITYSFQHGNQGPEHPNPGRPYYLVGFPRVAYLPNTPKGNKVLNLLQVAFNRRLIFTVGTSATSGAPDCVVWNGIHHKTESSNYSGHGYPDPKYLDNVLMELASFGITG